MLSDNSLKRLIEEQKLVLEPFSDEYIREAAIKIHLLEKAVRYRADAILDLKKDSVDIQEHCLLPKSGYMLKPGEFMIGMSLEKITMPNGYMGWIENSGSMARAGIQITLSDSHIDPGFSGHIFLEIKNQSNISVILYPNWYVAKLYIEEMSSYSDHIYHGKWNQKNIPEGYSYE